MIALVLLSLATLSTALSPVPLLAFSSSSFPALQDLQMADQATAFGHLFNHEDICNFDAVIVATQPALHATHLRSAYTTLVERYHASESGVHLPYLRYSVSPIEQARELAVRCNSKLLHVSAEEDTPVAIDVSQKHVICLQLPSFEELEADTVTRQLAAFSRIFPSHLTLFTGVPELSKRQLAAKSTATIPVPKPSPSAPLAAQSYRVLTPTLIFSFGLVFGLVVPLAYIAINALASIKSPVSSNSYKGPSSEKKNQ